MLSDSIDILLRSEKVSTYNFFFVASSEFGSALSGLSKIYSIFSHMPRIWKSGGLVYTLAQSVESYVPLLYCVYFSIVR